MDDSAVQLVLVNDYGEVQGKKTNYLVGHNNLVGFLANEWFFLAIVAFHVTQVLDDFREEFFGFLVKIGNRNTGSKDRIVWMINRHLRGSLGSEIVELNGCNAVINAINNLKC